MKKVLAGIAIASTLVVAAEVIGYFVALRSDAYASAAHFVKSDPQVAQRIGVVRGTRLAPFDAEIRFTPSSGDARFVVSADTTNGTTKVRVQLEQKDGLWTVTKWSVVS